MGWQMRFLGVKTSLIRMSIGCFLVIVVCGLSFSTAFKSIGKAEGSEAVGKFVPWIESQLSQNSVNSVEDVLKVLPSSFSKNKVLLYASQSPQDSTPQLPRMVFFTDNAETLLAIGGNPKSDSYPRIDVLEKNISGEYESALVDFSETHGSKISKNPASCLSCHADFHGVQPLRNVYSGGVFPGVFASVGESVLPQEAIWLNSFLQSAKSNPRYEAIFGSAPTFDPKAPNNLGDKLNSSFDETFFKSISEIEEFVPYRFSFVAANLCLYSKSTWRESIKRYLTAEDAKAVDAASAENDLILASASQFNSDLLRHSLYLNKGQIPQVPPDVAAKLRPTSEQLSGLNAQFFVFNLNLVLKKVKAVTYAELRTQLVPRYVSKERAEDPVVLLEVLASQPYFEVQDKAQNEILEFYSKWSRVWKSIARTRFANEENRVARSLVAAQKLLSKVDLDELKARLEISQSAACQFLEDKVSSQNLTR
jgi:hypothetical protein